MTGSTDAPNPDRDSPDRVDATRPWRQVSWVVIDVEGNGQRPPDLVEAACVLVDDAVPGPARTWLVRPPRPITRPVQRIHGISNGAVAASPSVTEIAGEIRAALAGRVVIGHQVHVDLSVLGRELDGWTPPAAVDTLRLARAVWPGLPSYSLDNLAATGRLTLPLPGSGDRHRAGYDAALTASLFIALANAADTPAGPTSGSPVSAARLLALGGAPGVPNLAGDDPSRLF